MIPKAIVVYAVWVTDCGSGFHTWRRPFPGEERTTDRLERFHRMKWTIYIQANVRVDITPRWCHPVQPRPCHVRLPHRKPRILTCTEEGHATPHLVFLARPRVGSIGFLVACLAGVDCHGSVRRCRILGLGAVSWVWRTAVFCCGLWD